MLRLGFAAMGTDIELLLAAPDGTDARDALRAAEEEFHRLERLLSRFNPDSELARLNRDGQIEAGPDLLRVTSLALAARDDTGGRFDPTVHNALVAAGYDRSFPDVPRDVACDGGEPPPCGGRVLLDCERSTIVLEDGARLDLGGIAKGDAADRAAAILGAVAPCLVNAGGDIAATRRADGMPWPIGLATPGVPITLGLDTGGLATSGRDRRRWLRGGRESHHVIDPTTGVPAETDLLKVTAVAHSTVAAEVHATALLLAGEHAAMREASESAVPAVLVTVDGRTVLAGGLS